MADGGIVGQAGSILLAFTLINARGMMRHDVRLYRLSTVRHHIDHHRNPQYNFGEEWIDRLCGTLMLLSRFFF